MDIEHSPIALGALLRHYRQAAMLTQKELAERARVSEHTISNLERGSRHTPRPDLVQLLTHALQLSAKEEAQFLAAARALRHPRAPRPHASDFPLPPTALIGRDQEVAALTTLLQSDHIRLVTLTGMGGVGKTHLALEVIRQLADSWHIPITVVDLATITAPDLVLPALAERLDMHESGGPSLLEGLKAFLQNQHRLLMLDNFEHLLPAALQLATLLEACPRLQFLVTSRSALQVRGEQEFPVLPLALPNLSEEASLANLARIPSVALFIAHAQAMQPTFTLTQENAAPIAAICRRLDGLPLALELAVTQLRLLSPAEVLARLDHPLQLLTRGPQDLPPRQKTLRATLDWSYGLLPTESQQLFQRLAVFAGNANLEAIEQICQRPEPVLLERLYPLMHAHLVQRASLPSDELRIHLLDVVRAYGWEHVIATGEADLLQRAHAIYYVALAEQAQSALRGPDQRVWQQRLGQESENLRAALDWAISQADGELGLRLAGALWRFWYQRGALSEGRYWLERALAAVQPAGATPARALALYGTGVLAFGQGAYAQATTFLQTALEMRRALGDQQGMAQALNNLGGIARMEGDYPLAKTFYEEGLACYRKLGDQHGISILLGNLAALAWEQGKYDRAQHLAEESLALEQALGNQTGAAITMEGLGLIALDQGDVARAQRWFENALEIGRTLGDGRRIARTLGYLGRVFLAQGNTTQAAAHHQESLAQAQTVEDKVGSAEAWLGLGEVALVEGASKQAAQCYHTSLALHQHLGKKRGIVQALEGLSQAYSLDDGETREETLCWAVQIAALAASIRVTANIGTAPEERTRLQMLETTLRARLGAEAFESAWKSGAALSVEAVLGKARFPQ